MIINIPIGETNMTDKPTTPEEWEQCKTYHHHDLGGGRGEGAIRREHAGEAALQQVES